MNTRHSFARSAGPVVVFLLIVLGLPFYLTPSAVTERRTPSPDGAIPRMWTERRATSGNAITPDPRLRCAAAIVVDNKLGEIVYAQDPHVVRPIASITKLLTALVLLESKVDLTTAIEIAPADVEGSSRSRLRPGEEYTLRDLLHAALIASDNRAARALSRGAGISQDQFITRMNAKALSLGMDSTLIVEPTGLSPENSATAYDCAILVNAALRNHLIAHITETPEYMIRPLNRKRIVPLGNTNHLLNSGWHFVGAKTGHINEAGWCIAARAHSDDGDDVTAVILGAPSSGQRFRSLANAFQWAFSLTEAASERANGLRGGS